MRAGADVFELFSINLGPFSSNVSRKTPLFSINLGPKRAMFLSRSVYVFEPLHLAKLEIAMPKPLSPVIEQLKDWRAKNKLSQSQAIRVFQAASLPVTLDALQNWESGRNNPSRLAASALADFLNRHQMVHPTGRNQVRERIPKASG
jgi:DNA-binding transcriptional regulator YiaG